MTRLCGEMETEDFLSTHMEELGSDAVHTRTMEW